MKKIYLVSLLLFGLIPLLKGAYVTGNFTNVSGVQNYTVWLDSNDYINGVCSIESINYVSISNGYGYWLSGSTNPFTVSWNSADCSVRNATMTITLTVKKSNGGSCNTTISINATSPTVTIAPSSSPLGALANISQGMTSSWPQKYTFSTSAANATGYTWSVTGGSIVGSSSGGTITVSANPGSCSISVNARAIGDCGQQSSLKSTSRTITPPSWVSGAISGPQTVGYAYGDYSSYSVTAPYATEYVWSLSAGSPFQKGGGISGTNSIFVNTYAGYGSGTVYVYAKNSCGQTSTLSKYITVGSGYPSRVDYPFSETTPLSVLNDPSSNRIALQIPNYMEPNLRVTIFNLNGDVIHSFIPDGPITEISSNLHDDGLFVVKATSDESSSTIKFLINN
jgi:hypothetical protein